MHNQVEILSPAGNWESMVAAVQNGANAVYLGGTIFSARQNADNFNKEELKQAVEYCHIRGVKVYLTVNTLLNDKEIQQLTEYILYAYNIGIDAVIVQDLGVAKLIKEVAPDLRLHGSTQMSIHNYEGVNVLKELGFKRVVLSRELNFQQIKNICDKSIIEIEIFVHGALCTSYSGQCLMSSLIGGRSGNRGRCAQPCRLPYSIIDTNSNQKLYEDFDNKYILSPKDLCLIKQMDKLKISGVTALKIEGRMKRPEYVAIVTGIYRHYLDNKLKVTEEDHEKLMQIFNRNGFTSGYFDNNIGSNMMSYDKSNNCGIHIGQVIKVNNQSNIVTIKLKDIIKKGDGIEIWTGDGDNCGTIIGKLILNGSFIEEATAGDVVEFNIRGRISKGDKVYRTSSANLIAESQASFSEKTDNRKIPIYGQCKIKLGQPMFISIWDDENNFVEYTGKLLAEKAINREITEEHIIQQLNKLGGTPFEFQDIKVEIDSGLSIPLSEINSVRRNAIDILQKKILNIYLPGSKVRRNIDITDVNNKINKYTNFNENTKNSMENKTGNIIGDKLQVENNKLKLSVQVNSFLQAQALIDSNIDRIYISANMIIDNSIRDKVFKIIESYMNKAIEVFCLIPRIFTDIDTKIYSELFNILNDIKITGVMIGNIGHIELFNDNINYKIHGDFSLNIFNSLSLDMLKKMKLSGATLSPEMTFRQIKTIRKPVDMETEIITYGRLPLMILENCPIGSLNQHLGDKCHDSCSDISYGLLDRKNMVFPIITNSLNCRTEILNSQQLFFIDEMDKLSSNDIKYIRVLFNIEKSETCVKVIDMYRDVLDMGKENAIKEHQDIIQQIKAQGFTRGHYYRGVE